MFKGIIKANSNVDVTFNAKTENVGIAHLLIALGRVGGTSSEDSDTASPAGVATVTMETDLQGAPKGLLRIFVDVASNKDGGQLIVKVNELPLQGSDENIIDDTTWLYAVV